MIQDEENLVLWDVHIIQGFDQYSNFNLSLMNSIQQILNKGYLPEKKTD